MNRWSCLSFGFCLLLGVAILRGGDPAPPLAVAPGSDQGPTLRMKITNVRPNCGFSETAPFIRDHGDWTFFDCTTLNDAAMKIPVTITIGVMQQKSDNAIIDWGRAVIFAKDRKTGGDFTAIFARAFSAKMPDPVDPTPIAPIQLHTAVLGTNLNEKLEGEKTGTWVASKWFAAEPGIDAEVFFNYDLSGQKAWFGEKDSDYRDDLVFFFAENLRDGPRPRRTAATDPNFTDKGLTLKMLGTIPDSSECNVEFIPGSDWIWIAPRTGKGLLRLVNTADVNKPVAIGGRFEGVLSVFPRGSDARQLVVVERLPDQPHTIGPDDKTRLWLIDRIANTRTQLTGNWGETAAVDSVSPDGRFVALSWWKKDPADPTRQKQSGAFYDFSHQSELDVDLPGMVAGWDGSGDKAQAIVQIGAASEEHWMKMSPTQSGPAVPVAIRDLPLHLQPGGSPDDKLKFILHEHASLEFQHADGSPGGRFTFHADDRRYAVDGSILWMSPRFLLFPARYTTVIDVQTLKMSYLPAELTEAEGHDFSPDLKWVWIEGPTGYSVGRMIMP